MFFKEKYQGNGCGCKASVNNGNQGNLGSRTSGFGDKKNPRVGKVVCFEKEKREEAFFLGFLDFDGFLKESVIQEDEEQLMQKTRLDNFNQISLPPTTFQLPFKMMLFNLQNKVALLFLIWFLLP